MAQRQQLLNVSARLRTTDLFNDLSVAEAALLGHVHLWDLAAPGAVLHAVGGCFVYLSSGAPVDFGPLADGRRAPGYVVAGRPDTLPRLLPELDARA